MSQQEIPENIVRFLKEHTCMHLTCVDEDHLPYSFTCFYVFDEQEQVLYFKSQSQTRHASILKENGAVSGTIVPDQFNPLAIQGIQFRAHAQENGMFDMSAAMQYLAKYPIAATVPGNMWTVKLFSMKFTDNTVGFGHKTNWDAFPASQ